MTPAERILEVMAAIGKPCSPGEMHDLSSLRYSPGEIAAICKKLAAENQINRLTDGRYALATYTAQPERKAKRAIAPRETKPRQEHAITHQEIIDAALAALREKMNPAITEVRNIPEKTALLDELGATLGEPFAAMLGEIASDLRSMST